jgi:hypothetical protein
VLGVRIPLCARIRDLGDRRLYVPDRRRATPRSHRSLPSRFACRSFAPSGMKCAGWSPRSVTVTSPPH